MHVAVALDARPGEQLGARSRRSADRPRDRGPTGAIGPKSTTSARLAAGRMHDHEADAAETAVPRLAHRQARRRSRPPRRPRVPPAARISAPTAAATPFCAATTPAARRRRPACGRPSSASDAPCQLTSTASTRVLIEGVMPGQARRLVIRRAVAPDGVFRRRFASPPSTSIVQYEQSPLNGQ